MLEDAVKDWADELRSEGKAEGREEGRVEGKAEGRAEGWEEGIKQTILILHNLKLSLEQIVTTISENYGLTLAEARERIVKYLP